MGLRTKIVGKFLKIYQPQLLINLKAILLPENPDFRLDYSTQLYSFVSTLNETFIPEKLFSVPSEFEFPFGGLEKRVYEQNYTVAWDNQNHRYATYEVSRHGQGKPEFRTDIRQYEEYQKRMEITISKLGLEGQVESKWSFGCMWGDEGICISDDLINKPLSL